jgi:tetratricopeptide (TPR) repeat protein
LTVVCVLLLSVARSLAADPSNATGDSIASLAGPLGTAALDLTDPWKRLAFARTLAQSSSSADEAAVALLRLTTHDLVGKKAREELYHLAVTVDLHPAWRDIYDSLLSAGDLTPDGRLLIGLRSASASASDPATRARGLAQLQSLMNANPRRADVRLALGDGLMLAGKVDEARAVYQGTEGGARSNEGTLLALSALGRADEAAEYVDVLGMDPRGAVASAVKGSLADRVQMLMKFGYVDATDAMLTRVDPARKESRAWEAFAAALLVRGDPKRASAVYAKLCAAAPDDAALRMAWTGALLEAGDLNGAKQAAAADERSLQLVYAAQLVSGGGVGNAEARAEEIGRAWRVAPNQPEVVRHQVELLLALGKVDEARRTIAPAVAARPRNAALAQLFDRVALAANQPNEALAAHRVSIGAAGPWDFWSGIGALAGIHTLVGEHLKERKQFDQGLYHYQVALALRPDAPEYYSGIGGLLWSAGRVEEGQTAYLEAHRLAPNDVGTLQAAVGISLSRGDVASAKTLLNSTGLRAPQIEKLREDVYVAEVLQQITDALDSGVESDARTAFQDLLVRYPDNGRILHALGDTLMRAGKAADALSAYQRARSFNPRDPWLTMAEATSHIELGDYEIANKLLDDLGDVQDEETRKALRRVRARALRAQGDDLWHERDQPEAAFEAYAQALSLDPEQWSLIALAGLYLEHRQPGAALAFLDEALTLDRGNPTALLGRINALQALGRLDDARAELEAIGRRKAGQEVWQIQEDMEIQLSLTEVDRLLLRGDIKRARDVLDDVAADHPDSPHVDAAMASLLMTQGQPGMALQRAERALQKDPTQGRALGVAMEAGLQLHKMADVVKLFEAALDAGGGERARASLDNAQFAASVQRATDLAREGRRMDAQRELQELRDAMTDNPDHWALLGGAYLGLNITNVARDVYERGLEIDSDHVPSLIGMASAHESMGNIQQSVHLLSDGFKRTRDPRLGLALAQIQGRLNRWKGGIQTLEAVRSGSGPDPSAASWTRREPLRLVPLPSGKPVDDEPPAAYEGLSGRISLSQVAEIEDTLSAVHYPYGDMGGGFMGRTGEIGLNLLDSGIGGATLEELQAGPFRVRLDVLSVLVDNGVDDELGVGGSIGLATPPNRRLTIDARVGSSPLGFTQTAYVTWLGTIRMAVDPHVTLGADTGRVPITDSLLSWAGAVDELTNTPFGQASYTWGGGWVSFLNPNLTDGGARFRTGFVEALSMERVGRRELTGWVGQTMGGDTFRIRIGGNFTWLAHDRQVDDFVFGEAGLFSPRNYTVGLVSGDLYWTPAFSGTSLCASAAIGVQSLDGEASPYFTPGTFRAFALGAGLGFPVSEDWRIGLDAKTESSGSDWNAQAVLFRIGYFPPWTGRRNFARPSEIHGTTIGNLAVCRL